MRYSDSGETIYATLVTAISAKRSARNQSVNFILVLDNAAKVAIVIAPA